MYESGYYPPGAEFDPSAPYNQPDCFDEDPDDYDYESDERDYSDYLQDILEDRRIEQRFR